MFDAYRQNDGAAAEIIDRNAKALAELLNAGISLYGASPIAIASGGIFEHYRDVMVAHVGKYSNVSLLVNGLPPVYGACKNAYTMANGQVADEFYENFKKTYEGASK